MKNQHNSAVDFDAWNPGITSQIPAALGPMITLYRPDNSTVDYQCAQELSDYCGLKAAELISFSVERLVNHELLVRVISDLSVPDGPNYEDLGINLRSMVSAIYQRHIFPEIGNLQNEYDSQLAEARQYMKQQLDEQLFAGNKP